MLRVGDLRELKDRLIQAGRLDSITPGELIEEAASWFERERPTDVLDHETFAQLCEGVRQTEHAALQAIASGAIRLIREYLNVDPAKSQFVARFALDAISTGTGIRRGWNTLTVSNSEYEEALELFEVARGDTAYSKQELISHAVDFIAEFEDSEGLFGRLAQDLNRLLDVLEVPECTDDHKEFARAALTYFAEVSDAIPDNLGPVGYLDDAIVVAYALQRIFPERSVLGGYLDDVVTRWPFLVDVVLKADQDARSLSEYMIVNAALLLTASREGSVREDIALVVPDAGPLTYVLGFLLAVASVFDQKQVEETPVYSVGDRLVDRSTGEEYRFDGYLDENQAICESSVAKYFAVVQPKRGAGRRLPKNRDKGPGDLRSIRPIVHIGALQLSGRETKTYKTGRTTIDLDTAEVGALERLFGSTKPIGLPNEVGTVVVVSVFKEAEELGRTLSLYGTPLMDVVSTGTARCDDEITFTRWSAERALGSGQLMTIVRSTADAIELVEDSNTNVVAVIASVRAGTTDVQNLRRVSEEGVAVLSVLDEGDEESQRELRDASFRFWMWDDEWLRHLHWPPAAERNTQHPVSRYEDQIERISTSLVDLQQVACPAIEALADRLDDLSAFLRGDEDELLRRFYDEAFVAFIALMRTLDTEVRRDATTRLERQIEIAAPWWSDEVISATRKVLAALLDAVEALHEENPKRIRAQRWAAEHSEGVVVAPAGMRANFVHEGEVRPMQWTPALRRRFILSPLLVPCWLAQKRMERLLHPPASPSVTLLLYGPEVAWCEALRNRRSRNRTRLRRLSRTRSAIPQARDLSAPEEPKEIAVHPPPAIDQIIVDYRRRQALASRSATEGYSEPVEARLVFFSGGHWAAFALNARIHTFTHLLESDAEVELPERAVVDLVPGDRVLMVKGSGRDALAHAADRHLSPGARTSARLWQTALRQHFEEHPSVKGLRDGLAAAGCERTTQTIRGWIHDDSRIGPSEPLEETLEAIHRVTRNVSLVENLKKCADSIRAVRSAHIRAGHDLQTRVLARVREWLGAEVSPDELIEVEDQVVLLTVEAVDSEIATVPRASLSQLREDA